MKNYLKKKWDSSQYYRRILISYFIIFLGNIFCGRRLNKKQRNLIYTKSLYILNSRIFDGMCSCIIQAEEFYYLTEDYLVDSSLLTKTLCNPDYIYIHYPEIYIYKPKVNYWLSFWFEVGKDKEIGYLKRKQILEQAIKLTEK